MLLVRFARWKGAELSISGKCGKCQKLWKKYFPPTRKMASIETYAPEEPVVEKIAYPGPFQEKVPQVEKTCTLQESNPRSKSPLTIENVVVFFRSMKRPRKSRRMKDSIP